MLKPSVHKYIGLWPPCLLWATLVKQFCSCKSSLCMYIVRKLLGIALIPGLLIVDQAGLAHDLYSWP